MTVSHCIVRGCHGTCSLSHLMLPMLVLVICACNLACSISYRISPTCSDDLVRVRSWGWGQGLRTGHRSEGTPLGSEGPPMGSLQACVSHVIPSGAHCSDTDFHTLINGIPISPCSMPGYSGVWRGSVQPGPAGRGTQSVSYSSSMEFRAPSPIGKPSSAGAHGAGGEPGQQEFPPGGLCWAVLELAD